MSGVQIAGDQASTALELRYNLFRRKGNPDLCCAVPEDGLVPRFVTDEYWAFAGTRDSAALPPGFDRTAAELGVHLNGFYLFQIAGPMRRPRGAAVKRGAQLVRSGPRRRVAMTMNGLMRRRIDRQSRLMAAMMVRLDVDAVAASEADRTEFSAATLRCLLCAHATQCGRWLADLNRRSDTHSFCPNAEFFHGCRRRSPVAENRSSDVIRD